MRRAVPLLALLLAIATAGCGGGGEHRISKAQYQQRYTAATTALQRAFQRIPTATAKTPLPQIADGLDRSAAALAAAAKAFDDVAPPKQAESSNRKLVTGLRQLAALYRQGAAAARKNDRTAVAGTLKTLPTSTGFKLVAAAQRELQAEGIATGAAAGR